MGDITSFRKHKDDFFADHPQSPLTRDQKKKFTGLPYFPENPDLRFELDVHRFEEDEKVHMQTSTGDVQEYLRYGKIHFTVDGQQAELTLYADHNGYFLPFVDSLAGKETYPAGRYLEPEEHPNGKLVIDFNKAYNPYCAYNEQWSCPLTPIENRLRVPIRAGEMNFAEH